jgi:uncharacterized protein YjbI with pentapeptide repeats
MHRTLSRWILASLIGLAIILSGCSLYLRLDSRLAREITYDPRSPLSQSELSRLRTEVDVEEWVGDLLEHLGSEFIVAGLVFLCVDLLLQRRERADIEREHQRREIERLGRQMGSHDNGLALQAIGELRAIGSLADGTLDGIDLGGSNLSNAALHGAVMRRARFDHAQLENVSLDGDNIESSRLHDAKLHGASLVSVRLWNADFLGAELDRANLSWAEMQGAINLTEQQLSVAYMLWGATMPNSNRYDGRFHLAGDLAEAGKWGFDISDGSALAAFYAGTSRERSG